MNRFFLSIILLLFLPLVATAADDREGSSVEELFSLEKQVSSFENLYENYYNKNIRG